MSAHPNPYDKTHPATAKGYWDIPADLTVPLFLRVSKVDRAAAWAACPPRAAVARLPWRTAKTGADSGEQPHKASARGLVTLRTIVTDMSRGRAARVKKRHALKALAAAGVREPAHGWRWAPKEVSSIKTLIDEWLDKKGK